MSSPRLSVALTPPSPGGRGGLDERGAALAALQAIIFLFPAGVAYLEGALWLADHRRSRRGKRQKR
jgi:hypothetical protein